MTWLKVGIACDGADCDEVFRGPRFPSSAAAATSMQAHNAGWRAIGSVADAGVRRHRCPTCTEEAERKARIARDTDTQARIAHAVATDLESWERCLSAGQPWPDVIEGES